MKPVLAALVSASLAAAPLAAAAQHHGGHSGGGGSWSGSGSGGAPGGGSHGGGAGTSHGGSGSWHGGSGSWAGGGSWAGHTGSWRGGGFRGGFEHHRFRGGFPVFFGGFALGSAWGPWGWDAPYYGYPAYTVVEHDSYPDPGYYYDRYQRDHEGAETPSPGEQAAPAPAACGHWQWNAGRSQYDWIGCDAPPPR